MIDYIGWMGAIMLSICGLPQAYKSYKQKHSHGISYLFLHLWLWGEVGQLIYVMYNLQYPIIFNCALNIILISVIIYHKYFPKTLFIDK